MIKCITLDLDGTLLNNKSKISEENQNVLKLAREQGIEIIIATGRNYPDVVEIFKETDLKTWIIGANGATIHDAKGQLFESIPMNTDKAMEILKWLEENEYYYEVFSEESIYYNQKGRDILQKELLQLKEEDSSISLAHLQTHLRIQFGQTGLTPVETYKDLHGKNIYNVLAFTFNRAKRERGWKTFEKETEVTLVTSGTYNFEFAHLEASKGNALTKVTNRLGIPLQQTIAMGDSMNDLSMLSKVGMPIAMGNAREDVKKIAKEITLTNDENGVAKALSNHLLVC